MHPDLQTPAKQILEAVALPEITNTLHTAFIAMGKARYNLQEAASAFQDIFKGQWPNGMIPHCMSTSQKPIPVETGRVEIANGIHTSRICMPPVLGLILWRMYQQSENKEAVMPLLKDCFAGIYRFHQYLYEVRDPLEEGIAYIRHPQESIAPASPDWEGIPIPNQEALGGKEEEVLYTQSPFAVQCPLFNALLCWSNECLIEIAFLLEEDLTELIQWQNLALHSLNEKCWSESSGRYFAYDLKKSEPVLLHSLAGLLPLCGGLPTQEQAEDMLGWLASAAFGAGQEYVLLCPTHSLESAAFKAEQTWGGAISLLGNWLLYQGLTRYDMTDAAEKVRRQSLYLISHYGFREHFHAHGKIIESGDEKSGLSAALCLDLL